MSPTRTTLLTFLVAPSIAVAAGPFQIRTEAGRIVSLQNSADPHHTEFLAKEGGIGRVLLQFRLGTGGWRSFDTNTAATISPGVWEAPGRVRVASVFRPDGERLRWSLQITNLSHESLDIAKLATPLATNGRFDRNDTVKGCVLKHSFISGDGSFIYWMPSHGDGPFLLMTPEAGTSPEFWQATKEGFEVYLHSTSELPTLRQHGSTWRIPQTHRTLAPGKVARYGYAFQWTKTFDDTRDALVQDGLLDVQVVPGMTVPTDLFAEVAFRAQASVKRVEPEFPAQTRVKAIGRKGDYQRYRVQFQRLGENRLTVSFGGKKTYLEFFVTEPVETLIKKRAAFLAKSQHRDPAKWYDGLITDWNMDSQTLLSPDNYDRIKGWRIYAVTCDDPGLAKPAYLAAKNVEFPVASEVEALDYYIKHFVWGGLQQTPSEPYPYGIYGIPDWHVLRNSEKKDRNGTEHLWRIYDYPHITLLYYSMYRIATLHPEIHTELTADEYLRRAAGTAEAMFTVPMNIEKWSAYETGLYNELVIVDLIQALDHKGLSAEAGRLRDHWAKKTKFFVTGNPDLFGSEYPFDSTGFESTHALARYAFEHGTELGISTKETKSFLERQLAGNLLCRGVIEPAYYYYGSDYRGSAGDAYTLSYMAQMGGSSVLDYALHYSDKPAPFVRLGVASYLSSWALMNSGTPESNYGYWYPGKANDGGAGGGFEPAAYGETWLGQPHHRGSWYYGCEIDLGFSGALRTAATVLADDPIFGRFCFLGTVRNVGKEVRITPRDGLRSRLYIRLSNVSGDILLDGAKVPTGKEIILTPGRSEIRVPIVLTARAAASVKIAGLGKDVQLTLNRRPFSTAQPLTEPGELKITWK